MDRRAFLRGGRRAADPVTLTQRSVESVAPTARQRYGDIVIQSVGRGIYVLQEIGGQRIGTAHDRREAMRQACARVSGTKAYVWIYDEENSAIYHEVLCP